MAQLRYGNDPEPSDRFPAGLLYVPVRPGPSGSAARLFRTPLGDRTAVGFTSESRLVATLGPDQAWIRLAEPALRSLTASLGVTTVTVDPQFTTPAPTAVTSQIPALRTA
ncbi:SAV_915 family protein [Streptomyces sp. NPDC093060]|uniref:SAV_915 family protein n=1 Tax=Streptomyces sp. NPDC093060 TaxID=3366019 RepID=UPI00382BD534